MLVIDGHFLQLRDVVRIARPDGAGDSLSVKLAPGAVTRLAEIRFAIEKDWLNDSAPAAYGFNTGVGKLKSIRIPLQCIDNFQTLLLNAHCAGVGDPLSEEVVRAAMLLRANAHAIGCSGVRPELIDRLLAMLNAGIHPIIPEKGSVGASGDLAPLAYLASALVGHPQAEVFVAGRRLLASEALATAGLSPTFELKAKEALALINGSTISLAVAVLASEDARSCLRTAEIALALSLESMRAETAAFDSRIHDVRPHAGQSLAASNIRRLLAGSQRCTTQARMRDLKQNVGLGNETLGQRIQDAYSLRCSPQVHGPVHDALRFIDGILATELNSATDNPLVFWSERADGVEVLSGGNFHGQYLALCMDLLALVMTDLGSISERRINRILDPTLSYGLPPNLVAQSPGLNTGFSILHCTTAALVTENKTLCSPASVDSIPTKSNQEDHVSNSTWCARKAASVIRNVQSIIAAELIVATQALSVSEAALGDLRLGAGTSVAFRIIREFLAPMLGDDRRIHADFEAAQELVRSGTLERSVDSELNENIL